LKRKLAILLIVAVVLIIALFSCGGRGILYLNPIKGVPQASIDWVDFVKLKNNQYTGLHNAIIADPALVTDEVVGEVKFKVADIVTNASYRIQPGDAAYLDIGTKLYRVEGYDTSVLIAAIDERSINGYRLYVANDQRDPFKTSFREGMKKNIEKIEWYSLEDGKSPLVVLDAARSNELVTLLQEGEPKLSSNNNNGYQQNYYKLYIFNGEPIAYSYTMLDNGLQVLFYGYDEPVVLDESIREWMNHFQAVH